LFSNFLQPVFGSAPAAGPVAHDEGMLQIGTSLVSLAGIFMATLFYVIRPAYAKTVSSIKLFEHISKFWFAGWGFDALYDTILVRPFLWIARMNRNDIVDSGYTGIAYLNRAIHITLSKTQTGNLRWYAMGIAVGAVVVLGAVIIIK